MFKRRDRAYTKEYNPLTNWINKLCGRDVRKLDIIHIKQKVPVPSFLYAESSVGVLINYCEGFKVPKETRFLIDQFAQHIQA